MKKLTRRELLQAAGVLGLSSMPAFGSNFGLKILGGAPYRPNFSAEALAFFARLATKPTYPQKVAYNNLIVALKAAGVWSTLDALYLFGVPNSATALTNLVQNNYNCTGVNTPTFTSGIGFSSAGTAYLDTGFNPTTASSPNCTENNAHVSWWGLLPTPTNGSIFGQNTLPWAYADPCPAGGTGIFAGRLFLSGGFSLGNTYTGSGFMSIVKPASASNIYYRRYQAPVPAGVLPMLPAVTTISGTDEISNGDFTFLKGDDGDYAGPIAFGAFGSALTAAQVSALYAAVANFFAASTFTFVAHGDSITYDLNCAASGGTPTPVLGYQSALCDQLASNNNEIAAYQSWGSPGSGFFYGGSASITNIVETSGNVVTLTTAVSGLEAGEIVYLSGLTVGTWLNGLAVLLLSGTTSTSLVFNDPTSHGTQVLASETGTALFETLIQSAPRVIDPYLATVSNPWLIVFAGTNDLWVQLGNLTGAQAYTYFQTYIAARIAAGWNPAHIIVLTCLPRQNNSTFETNRLAFNVLLRSGAATYGYVVADVGNDPTIGQNGDQNNTTYYNADTIHPNAAGHAIIAADILAVA